MDAVGDLGEDGPARAADHHVDRADRADRDGSCLTTSHPSSLYLAGRQMVPTHNTTYSGMFLPAWFLGMFPALRAIFVSYGDDYSVKYGRAVRTIIDKFGR